MHRIFAMPWLLMGGLARPSPGWAAGREPGPDLLPRNRPLVVLLNGTTRLQLASKKPIKTVINPKEALLTLRTVERDPTTVLLVGTAPGITRIELEDADGNREVATSSSRPMSNTSPASSAGPSRCPTSMSSPTAPTRSS